MDLCCPGQKSSSRAEFVRRNIGPAGIIASIRKGGGGTRGAGVFAFLNSSAALHSVSRDLWVEKAYKGFRDLDPASSEYVEIFE